MNRLEVAINRGILAGLPMKSTDEVHPKISSSYVQGVFRVLRLRLGKDSPAHFEPTIVKTLPGAELRKGYNINMSDLDKESLDSLEQQLKLNKSMGVVSDDVPAESLSTKQTASDITIDFYHYRYLRQRPKRSKRNTSASSVHGGLRRREICRSTDVTASTTMTQRKKLTKLRLRKWLSHVDYS